MMRNDGSAKIRGFVFGFLAAIVIPPAGWMLFFVLGFSQIGADSAPSSIETAILRSAVRHSIERSAADVPSTPAVNEDAVVEGGKLYVAGCAGCHGALGGTFREDHDHFPPVPQLPHVGTQYSEPELYWIVKHGIRMTGMSAYGPFYSEKQLYSLAAFLHRIDHLPPEVVDKIRSKSAG
jgi:mono/diheme cytochrome c family protein